MTLRYSSGAVSFLAQHGSFKEAFNNGILEIYTGIQPASADAAPTGTKLCAITASSLARTAEVQAYGTVTLTGGASGSINTVTVNSVNIIENAVPFNTSLTQTATDLAAEINRSASFPEYTASASGAVVTIKAKRGAGALPNGFAVTATLTTITATYANMASGVSAVNGLKFGAAVAGVIAKLSTQTWSGVNLASGTAGWYRFTGSVADSEVADSTESQIREDGAIATSGAQLNLSSTALTISATTTIDTWTRTVPAA